MLLALLAKSVKWGGFEDILTSFYSSGVWVQVELIKKKQKTENDIVLIWHEWSESNPILVRSAVS